MNDFRVKLTQDSTIFIPLEYCQALRIQSGDELILRLEDDELRIYTPRQAMKKAQELVRKHLPAGKSLSDELLVERRKET